MQLVSQKVLQEGQVVYLFIILCFNYQTISRFVEHLKSSHNHFMTETELKDMLIKNRNEAKRLEQEYFQNDGVCEVQMEIEVDQDQMDEEASYIEYLVSED